MRMVVSSPASVMTAASDTIEGNGWATEMATSALPWARASSTAVAAAWSDKVEPSVGTRIFLHMAR